MEHQLVGMPAFSCIGLERAGSLSDCRDWVPRLWTEFVERSQEIRHLERGAVWGLMSDPESYLSPWKGATGRYLAGCQVPRGTESFGDWVVWDLPASCWMKIPLRMDQYEQGLEHMREFSRSSPHWRREGALHEMYPTDFLDPKTDLMYLMAPLVPRADIASAGS